MKVRMQVCGYGYEGQGVDMGVMAKVTKRTKGAKRDLKD